MAHSTPNSNLKTEAIKPQRLSVTSGPNVSTTSNIPSTEALRIVESLVRKLVEAAR
jgi:hypothetical protein